MPTIRELLAKLGNAKRDEARAESNIPTTGPKSAAVKPFKQRPMVSNIRRSGGGGKRGA
jgi:hypothetical protein